MAAAPHTTSVFGSASDPFRFTLMSSSAIIRGPVVGIPLACAAISVAGAELSLGPRRMAPSHRGPHHTVRCWHHCLGHRTGRRRSGDRPYCPASLILRWLVRHANGPDRSLQRVDSRPTTYRNKVGNSGHRNRLRHRTVQRRSRRFHVLSNWHWATGYRQVLTETTEPGSPIQLARLDLRSLVVAAWAACVRCLAGERLS